MILLLTLGCAGDAEEATELWQTPGAENTASWAAAEGVAWCRDSWQSDAHLVSAFRLPDTSWAITTFSESDPESVCEWSDYISLDAEPTGEILKAEGYTPGFEYAASDTMTGWAVDSDTVTAEFGLGEHDFFWLMPAAHLRQNEEWADLLADADDDLPVILAAEGISGPEYFLVDGRSGAQLN